MKKLTVKWSKKERGLIFYWPDGGKHGARLIYNALYGRLGRTNVVSELKARGYDITTLKFSVELKRENEKSTP